MSLERRSTLVSPRIRVFSLSDAAAFAPIQQIICFSFAGPGPSYQPSLRLEDLAQVGRDTGIIVSLFFGPPGKQDLYMLGRCGAQELIRKAILGQTSLGWCPICFAGRKDVYQRPEDPSIVSFSLYITRPMRSSPTTWYRFNFSTSW